MTTFLCGFAYNLHSCQNAARTPKGRPKLSRTYNGLGRCSCYTLIQRHQGPDNCPNGRYKVTRAVINERERTGLLKVVLIVVFDWSIVLIWLPDPAACTYGPNDVGQHNRGSSEEFPYLRHQPGLHNVTVNPAADIPVEGNHCPAFSLLHPCPFYKALM